MAMKAILIAAIIANIAFPAFSTDYIVGDDSGWTLGVDYAAWAQGKNFFIGDRIVFKYAQGAHNVYKVNGTAFQACSKPFTSSEVLTSGNDVVTLSTPGKKWYFCGVGNHCALGLKLAISVSGSVNNAAPVRGWVNPAPASAPLSGSVDVAAASAPALSSGTSSANHQKHSPSISCVVMVVAAYFANLKMMHWA